MSRIVRLLVVSGVVSAWAVMGSMGASLPFSDGFEGAVLGADWVTNGTVSLTAAEAATGAKSCYVLSGSNTVSFAGNPDNVWVSFYTKPIDLGALPPPVANDSVAALYVTDEGKLMVLAGGAWIVLSEGLPTANWLGFTVHLDYVAKKWDVYGATTTGVATMSKLNVEPLEFSYDGPFLGPAFSIETSAGKAVYIDDVKASFGYTGVTADTGTNAVTATTSIILGPGMNAGALARYFDDENNTLAGALGDALGYGLDLGNKVHIWNGTGFDTFVWTSAGDYNYWNPSVDAADTHITPTTGFYLETSRSVITAGVAFAEFDTSPVPEDVIFPPTSWNQIRWPKTTTVSVNSTAMGFSDADTGDLLYLYQTNGRFKRLWYDSNLGRWRAGSLVAGDQVSEGQGGWRFNAGASELWDLTL